MISTPKRKCDFKVNKMSFWLCEDVSYLLFNSPQWESPSFVSKIRIIEVTGVGGEVIRYDAHVHHPEQDIDFEYSDSECENKTIFEKWNKCLAKIDKLLFS